MTEAVRTSPFDYRHRVSLHALLFALAFWAPWTIYGRARFHFSFLTPRSLWSFGMAEISHAGWLTMSGAAVSMLLISIALIALGAFLRVWGAAYLGNTIVQSPTMHGSRILADGPYRHVRNPLYIGTFLVALGLTLIMSPSGALFIVVAIGLLQMRLVEVEEPFLAARLGEAYTRYRREVPRWLYSIPPRVPAGGARPAWLQALAGEFGMVATALGFAVMGWRYNSFLLMEVVIVAFGLGLVVQGLLPRRSL
jgi:protein-S-isoprenylcysteine O-methyltransferase Ste14